MLRLLVGMTIALTCADHWTTWLCLHAPVVGYSVVEANPVAGWLFAHTGLGTGLLIDSLLTVTAIAYLALTSALADGVKLALLAIIACCTGFAVVSNLGAITQMGLAPWSGSL